jgi:glycosyltransferase involved in cell wall biosynthesis
MTNKLVILHIRTSSYGGGGPDKTILKSVQSYPHKGFELNVAYLRRNDRDITPILERAHAAGTEYHELPGKKFLDLRQLRAVRQLIKKLDVDILHCHDRKTDFYGILLRRQCPGLVIVSTMHGWITGPRIAWILNLLDRCILRSYDSVIAVSQSIKRKAAQLGVRNVKVIYNAIDTQEWHRGLATDVESLDLPGKPSTFRVGFVGRLSWEKGPHLFVHTAAAVLEVEPDIRFVLSGEGPRLNETRDLVHSLGIDHAVAFIGYVFQEQLLALYRQLHVLLLTSITEGLPNCLLEAGAMQVPVVATRVGGVEEIVQDGRSGILVEPGNIKGLAEAVVQLKRDPGLAKNMGQKARSIIESRFDFERRKRLMEAFYHEVATLHQKPNKSTRKRVNAA